MLAAPADWLQDRLVVIRDQNGTLRTALPEEHDRMNRVYYAQPHRPVKPPPLFSGQHLDDALGRDKHEFVLDWACHFFEPDDPDYVQVGGPGPAPSSSWPSKSSTTC